jgi:phage baseplate assembly protein W
MKNQNIKKATTYSDFDLAFKIHPARKDLVLSVDVQSINRSIRNLILTNHYERPFRPEIGSNVSKMLFEPNITLVNNFLTREIKDVIKNFEPRVNLSEVNIRSTDSNALIVEIIYYIINSTEAQKLQIPLQRDRF